jgi:uroporphyrinogen decarboxylase
MELEFQLSAEVFGAEYRALRREDLEGVSGARRQDLLKRNAEMWVMVAERFGHNIITGLHWLDIEDQCRSFEYIREIAGDTYMLSAFCDGTFAIPSGENMMAHVIRLVEHEEEELREADLRVAGQIQQAQKLIEAGAEVVLMCSDYCFNEGPFLSPTMFARFVTPFLAKLVAGVHEAGGYAVKHTDGNIMPILDQLVGTGIDGLHSLDPLGGVDIAEVKRLAGDRVCLIGNVNMPFIQRGTPAQIEESCLYCLEHGGVEQGGYIYATSNCIFEGVPIENYELMLELREAYGYAGQSPWVHQ